jgi:hypothetical protein
MRHPSLQHRLNTLFHYPAEAALFRSQTPALAVVALFHSRTPVVAVLVHSWTQLDQFLQQTTLMGDLRLLNECRIWKSEYFRSGAGCVLLFPVVWSCSQREI